MGTHGEGRARFGGWRRWVVVTALAAAGPTIAATAVPAAPLPQAPTRDRVAPPLAVSRAGDAGRRTVLAARWPLTKAQTDFYKMVILPDGYPATRFKGKLVPHPMYGNYLVEAFLADYRRTRDVRSRDALVVVARASVRRMRPFRGGLVFWYEPGRTVVMQGPAGRAYSALTQAYYMDHLHAAGVELGLKDLRVAARLAFRSLLVPTSLGGVNRRGAVGPVLEEMPQTVPSAILNGWLSVLASLKSYADASGGAADVRALLTSSAREVARRLPRYDLPAVLGTSYGGYGRMALRLDVPVGTAVTGGALVVDGRAIPLLLGTGGQRSDAVTVLACGRRRGSTVVATCSSLRLEVPVTQAGTSWGNTVRLSLRAPAGRRVRATVHRGVYRFVHRSGRAVSGWTGRRPVSSSRSTATVSLAVPSRVITDALTPTTFKFYGGHYVNTYHRTHVRRMTTLAEEGGAPFTRYAARWRSYSCRWAGHPAYRLVPRGDLGCV